MTLDILRDISHKFKSEYSVNYIVSINGDPNYIIKVSKAINELSKMVDDTEEGKKLKKNLKSLKRISRNYFRIRMRKLIKDFGRIYSRRDMSGLYSTERLFVRSVVAIYNAINGYVDDVLKRGEVINKKDLYKTILKKLANIYRMNVVFEEEVKEVKESKPKKNMVILQFVKPVPKLINPSGGTIGPFDEGDIVVLDYEKNKQFIEGIIKAGYAEML